MNDEAYWFKHIRCWQQRKLTQHEYCDAYDLNYSRFGAYRSVYLKDKTKRRYQRTVLKSFAPVEVHDHDVEDNAVEMKPIIMNLPNGVDVTVSGDFNLEHLLNVLKVIQQAHDSQ